MHAGAAVERAGEEAHEERKRGEKIHGRDEHEMEETVVGAGTGGEAGVVAELIAVGHGDEQGGLRGREFAAEVERVGFAAVAKKKSRGGEQIRAQAAHGESFKMGEHGGVETGAHRAKENAAIGFADVNKPGT